MIVLASLVVASVTEALSETSLASSLWIEHGGLVSYGPDYYAQGVQAARLVIKILRGTRPEELPVEAADRIYLTVNLKTAGLLGLTTPRKILIRADSIRR